MGGDDIQRHQLQDALGVVLGEPVGDPRPSVVPHQEKLLVAQRLHHFDLVQGHGALGVVGVFRVAVGLPLSP